MSEYLLTKSIGRKDKLTIVALFYLRLNPSMMSKKIMGRFGWLQASKCRKRPAQPDFFEKLKRGGCPLCDYSSEPNVIHSIYNSENTGLPPKRTLWAL